MKVKLQEILDNRNISIYSLSKEIGVAQNNLSKLVKGETTSIKYDILEKLCNILDITPNDIFEVEPQLTLFNYDNFNIKQTLLSQDTLESIKNISIDRNSTIINNEKNLKNKELDVELDQIQKRIDKEYDLNENLKVIVNYILKKANLNSLKSKIQSELNALQAVNDDIPFTFRFLLAFHSLYYIVMKQMYNKQLVDFLQHMKRIYIDNSGSLIINNDDLNDLLNESNELLKLYELEKD